MNIEHTKNDTREHAVSLKKRKILTKPQNCHPPAVAKSTKKLAPVAITAEMIGDTILTMEK